MHQLKSLLLFPIIAMVAIMISSCQESPTNVTQGTQTVTITEQIYST